MVIYPAFSASWFEFSMASTVTVESLILPLVYSWIIFKEFCHFNTSKTIYLSVSQLVRKSGDWKKPPNLWYFSSDTQYKCLPNISIKEVLKWFNFKGKSSLFRYRNAMTRLEELHYILLYKHIPSLIAIAVFTASSRYFPSNNRIKKSLKLITLKYYRADCNSNERLQRWYT